MSDTLLKISKQKAVKILERRIEELYQQNVDIEVWRRSTSEDLEKIFPAYDDKYILIRYLPFAPDNSCKFTSQKQRAKNYLVDFIDKINTYYACPVELHIYAEKKKTEQLEKSSKQLSPQVDSILPQVPQIKEEIVSEEKITMLFLFKEPKKAVRYLWQLFLNTPFKKIWKIIMAYFCKLYI